MRRSVKARDAYDIHLLNEIGAVLSLNLRAHLQDTILGNEIASETISDRIDRIGVNLCRLELKPILLLRGALMQEVICRLLQG